MKAYAIGVNFLYQDARTILDIGGQDSKVISVKPDGIVARFEMKDRYAAGTEECNSTPYQCIKDLM